MLSADGVWLVRLDALAAPELVPAAVAAALHVHEQAGRPLVECLVEEIGFGHVLLVLDNCEHVIVAGAEPVQTLLESCPRLHVIATSREALRVPGELAWRVQSLSLPTSADTVPDNTASPPVMEKGGLTHCWCCRSRTTAATWFSSIDSRPTGGHNSARSLVVELKTPLAGFLSSLDTIPMVSPAALDT